jgi:hypothetical protein
MPKILVVAARLLVRLVNPVVTAPVVLAFVVVGNVIPPEQYVVMKGIHAEVVNNVVTEIVFRKMQNVVVMVQLVNADVVSQLQKQRKQRQ